ncbi:MAG: hypothetical protein WCP22_08000 [Chlamydiota bacterium]
MNGKEPILEFADVTIASARLGHAGMRCVNQRFLPGTLTLIRAEEGSEHVPIAGMAEGLLPLEEGRVLCMGEVWTAMPPERALQRRARIGRVFDGCGWISNLSVEENVALSQRHHTGRPAAQILAEAESLARAFGLSEVPKIRPALVPHQDLRRAEWVRAFLGSPLLILLEYPMRGVPPGHLPRLIAAVREACARKAAVLWLTDSDRVERHAELPPASRYAMRGAALAAVENG